MSSSGEGGMEWEGEVGGVGMLMVERGRDANGGG
jgi:hypothetical protein